MTKKTETMNIKNTTKQQATKPRRKKIQYDAEYIAYIENGESGAVFITRDIADDIDTTGKWIDVVEVEFEKLIEAYEVESNNASRLAKNNYIDPSYRINDYRYFVVELFDRQEQPKYTKDMTIDEKKYLTWEVATRDIENQRNNGVTGPKYFVIPKLIKLKVGKGEYRIVKDNSYSFYQREYSKFLVTQKPEWKYKIIATRKLNDKQFMFIRDNHFKIFRKIEDKKAVKLEYFNLR